jgi:hypothetical protein
MIDDFIPTTVGLTGAQGDARYLRADSDSTPIAGDAGGVAFATTATTYVERVLATTTVTTPVSATGNGGLQVYVTQTTGAITLPSAEMIGANALPSGAATFLLVSPPVVGVRSWFVTELTAIP